MEHRAPRAAAWLAAALTAVALAAAPGRAQAPPPPPLPPPPGAADMPRARLVVEAQGAPDSSRAAVERELALVLIRDEDCPVVIVDPADDTTPVALEIRVVVGLWREKQEPGGAPVWDPMTNREKPGILHRVDAQYDVAVAAGDDPARRQQKSYRAHTSAATERVPIDPVLRARREMVWEMGARVSRMVCRALKAR